MQYQQLEQDYKDDVLAEAIYNREVEYFHYDLDRENFTRMLADLPPGAFRVDLEKRLAETLDRMKQVETIHTALVAKVDNPGRHQAAVARVSAKRKAAVV